MALSGEQRISPLQVSRGRWHSGLTESNHLAYAFLSEPAILSETLSYVFGRMYKNPLELLTNGLGKTKVLGNREYDWYMMGDHEKSIPVVENFGDGGLTPGIGGTSFRVRFPEKYFAMRDILISDSKTQVRVMEEPYQDGTDWVYVLRLTTSDASKFISPADLAPGAEFSKEFTAVSEFEEGGNTTYATPFKLRNHMSTLRKAYAVTREAATDVMILRMPDPANPSKTTELWTKFQEWTAMSQWYMEKERALMYNRYNADAVGTVSLQGTDGRPVYLGAGIEQQIEAGEVREYTVLTENIIREFLMDLSYNRKDSGERKFVALTGEYGMDAFDRAMKSSMQSYNIIDTKFITGSGRELGFGGQFKTYRGLNGTELTLMHYPMYDDTVRNRRLHPTTGRPLESYKFTVLDISNIGGQPNICKVTKKDSQDLMWHVAGSISPYGPAKAMSTMRSNAKDGYSVHFLTEEGVQILNPTSCGQLICVAQ